MARRSTWSRIKSLWQMAGRSLYGVAAMGLALGIGIGMGLWLGDVADPAKPRTPPKIAATNPPPRAVAPSQPAAPTAPHLSVAPWVPDPRRAPPPALDLPPPDPLNPPAPNGAAAPPGSSPVLPDLPLAQPPQQEGALPLWRRNAVPLADAQDRPLIAVVIDDMGVDQRHSREAAALPGPLTLAYLPYAHDLPDQTAAAHRAGHELMVHMPMQPQSRIGIGGQAESGGDPGPNALTVGLAPEEVRRRVAWALGQFTGYVGINNHMGSAFTTNRAGMAAVMAELKARGLLFLDSRTIAASVGEAEAAAAGVPHATRNVFLDNIQTDAEVLARLAELERIAKVRGAAIAIGHPHATTIAALRQWLPTVAERGFALAPLSAVVARNSSGAGVGTAEARRHAADHPLR
jgi:polysaccharide deacetylase 2 family uncharacterized protein YibQ